jgi:extradiol dioxygenase family protein
LISRTQPILGTPSQTGVEVRDIAEARRFYQEVLGCSETPCDEQWLDFNLYGHPIMCRLNPQLGRQGRVASRYHPVEGKYVQVPIYSVVLELSEWRLLVRRLKQHKAKFRI